MALNGRIWTSWPQIDQIVGLAMNRATAAYIAALDSSSYGATEWQTVASALAKVKQTTIAHSNAGDPIPSTQSADYQAIDAAIDPMMADSDVASAVAELPFAVSQNTPDDYSSYGLSTGTPLDSENAGPGPMVAVISLAVLTTGLFWAWFMWNKGGK